jgi:hypothetical protein
MVDATKFAQVPPVGSTIVVSTGFGPRPLLTVVAGRGTKDGEAIFFFHEGTGWARPEDIVVIPDRMAGMMRKVYESLRKRHPAILSEESMGEIYLAVLPSYVDTGDEGADLAKLRDAVVAEIDRLEIVAPGP